MVIVKDQQYWIGEIGAITSDLPTPGNGSKEKEIRLGSRRIVWNI
jgi:hypothetical protein